MAKAPIWLQPAPGARKPKFTREQLAAAALEIADREGFAALSMRRVAEVLGAGTMTLYHYVRTKDDLLTLIDDALMAKVVERTGRLPRDWRASLRKIAHAIRDTFLEHPWALYSLQGARLGPNGLRHVEQSLEAVERLPVDLHTKVSILSIVDDYVFGHVLRAGELASFQVPDAATLRAMNAFTADLLRAGAYPRIAAQIGRQAPMSFFLRYAKVMVHPRRFDDGLDALLDGLEASLPRRRRRRPPVKG